MTAILSRSQCVNSKDAQSTVQLSCDADLWDYDHDRGGNGDAHDEHIKCPIYFWPAGRTTSNKKARLRWNKDLSSFVKLKWYKYITLWWNAIHVLLKNVIYHDGSKHATLDILLVSLNWIQMSGKCLWLLLIRGAQFNDNINGNSYLYSTILNITLCFILRLYTIVVIRSAMDKAVPKDQAWKIMAWNLVSYARDWTQCCEWNCTSQITGSTHRDAHCANSVKN